MTPPTKTERPLVLGLGEILWDLLPAGKQLGGAPANFAFHAHQMGARGHVVSAVGEDPLGQEILGRLGELELDRTTIASLNSHPTGTVTVSLDQRGVPTYTIHEKVAWDFIPATDRALELARQASAICFGSLAQRSEVSRATIHRMLAATADSALCVFDINLRQHYYSGAIIEESLERADVLKINEEEWEIVTAMLDLEAPPYEQAMAIIERFNLQLIALTRGERGSLLISPKDKSSHEGHAAEIKDTVGAGDAFTAVMVWGLLHGWDLDAINDRANRVAAYVCSQYGATPELPADLIASMGIE